MRVLLVEDDKPLAEFVRKGLKENGCAVDVAHDGDDGEALARTEAYDVIVLDIMLPRQSGFEVLRSIRAAGVSVPVLLLLQVLVVTTPAVGMVEPIPLSDVQKFHGD